jgi:outer membrane protein
MKFKRQKAAAATSLLILFICGFGFSINAQTATPTPPVRSVDPNADSVNLKRVGIDTSQTLTLSLDEAIRKALENNNGIEIAREDVKIAETRLRSLLGVYDPVFTISPTFDRRTQSGASPSNDFSVDFGLSKQLKSGGRFDSFFNNSRSGTVFTNSTGTSTTASSFSAFYSSTGGVRFTQPLFRNRSVDATRRSIRIQRKSLQQTDADFRRVTIDVISQVQRAYWDLVFALRDQQNRVLNLNLTRESIRQVEAKITEGKSAPLERAEIATELANREADLLIASQQVAIADNTLKQLLLREPNSAEWSKQLVPTDQPNFDTTPISLDDALADARANRPELRRLKLQSEINAIDIEYFKNQTKPQIDLNTTFSLNGYGQNIRDTGATETPLLTSASDLYLLKAINTIRPLGVSEFVNPNITIPGTGTSRGGFGGSLSSLFNANSPSLTVGVTFSFPLHNQTAKADLAGARFQQQQIDAQTRSQEQTVVAEVRNAVQAVETARLRVMTSRRARQNAEIQLEGEKKLYEVGRSTTFLLFQRENALANARNAEIRAETDYNKAISDLQRTTSTTFRANNIEVDSPMENK